MMEQKYPAVRPLNNAPGRSVFGRLPVTNEQLWGKTAVPAVLDM
ncbi:MAG: hypothetical protein PHT49_04870 [Desulfovibrionales bacterium]|nr:hypothetical protein [Desulfovibrionales bacterium]